MTNPVNLKKQFATKKTRQAKQRPEIPELTELMATYCQVRRALCGSGLMFAMVRWTMVHMFRNMPGMTGRMMMDRGMFDFMRQRFPQHAGRQ